MGEMKSVCRLREARPVPTSCPRLPFLHNHVFFSLRANAAPPFLHSDATYVLLSGLPGGVESESMHRDQLQSWLQILESIHPKQMIVLADSPENVGPDEATTNTSLTVFPSSRSNFLALSSMTSLSNSLVVIVWGYGGKQGSTPPVFHVRGPRITPTDFTTFAQKTESIESYWLLCFRGSGYFAAKLAGGASRNPFIGKRHHVQQRPGGNVLDPEEHSRDADQFV